MITERLSIVSTDGTRLTAWRSGVGPPLLLVHGRSGSHLSFAQMLPFLEPHFTVYALDRRGRGGSGDGIGFSIQLEFEDIASVVRAVGSGVALLGDSYGATVSLGAALLVQSLRKLVLFEPTPVIAREQLQAIDHAEHLLATGDRENAVITLLLASGLSPEEVLHLRNATTWQARVDAAHTVPRESRAEATWQFKEERLDEMVTSTLVLVGSESPPGTQEGARRIVAALPECRLTVLSGHGRSAPSSAPEVFAAAVITFLNRSDSNTASNSGGNQG